MDENTKTEQILSVIERKSDQIGEELSDYCLEAQILAVEKDHTLIRHIKNPSEEVQVAAIAKEIRAQRDLADNYDFDTETGIREGESWETIPRTIDLIENPCEKALLIAVQANPDALKYIKNPSRLITLAAVKAFPESIRYVENPDHTLQMTAVTESPHSIGDIKNPDLDIQLVAVRRNGWLISNIKNPCKQVQLEAVKSHGDAIKHIEDPDDEIKFAAVKNSLRAIKYIKDPSEELQMIAVKKDASNIFLIKNPAGRVMEEAINRDPSIMYRLMEQGKDQQLFVLKKAYAEYDISKSEEWERIVGRMLRNVKIKNLSPEAEELIKSMSQEIRDRTAEMLEDHGLIYHSKDLLIFAGGIPDVPEAVLDNMGVSRENIYSASYAAGTENLYTVRNYYKDYIGFYAGRPYDSMSRRKAYFTAGEVKECVEALVKLDIAKHGNMDTASLKKLTDAGNGIRIYCGSVMDMNRDADKDR